MITRQRSLHLSSLAVLLLVFSNGNALAGDDRQRLANQFQGAVAQYDAGNFSEAAQQLESLLREVPESFDAHELLGILAAILILSGW